MSLIGLWIWVLGCAPPPLNDLALESEPSIEILFPETREDVVICRQFAMVVDVDAFDLVEYDDGSTDVDGEGHWHTYIGGTYIGSSPYHWKQLDLSEEEAGPQILVAILASNVHDELGITGTAEFILADESQSEECIGGVQPTSTQGTQRQGSSWENGG